MTRGVVLCLFAVTAACAMSRPATFGPVEREVKRRLELDVRWSTDERVPAAVTALLQRPLDREAVTKIALATNRRLQAHYDELGIAASEIAAATVLAPVSVDFEHKFADNHTGSETEIDITQDILGLLQIVQRRGIAKAGLSAARARAVAATVGLVASVEVAFIDAVAAHQELELRQSAFDAASASADIAERMHAAGNAPDLTLVRERDQRELARIDLARAQTHVELAREALNEVIGLTGQDTRWTLAGRLEEPPIAPPKLDALERDAVGASLDLAATRADAEAAAGRVGVARLRSFLPQLGVGAAIDRGDGAWNVGPALSIGIPLFDQGQGPRARANAELRRARNLNTAMGIELRARARAIRQRLLLAHAEARQLRDVVLPLRQRILDETLRQYNAMNASTFELLSSRRDLIEAGRQYIDAVRRYWRASADARAIERGGMPRGRDDGPASGSVSAAQGAE